MSKFAIAAAFIAALGLAFAGSGYAGGLGQTALGNCVDSVVAACNKKKSDASVRACANSGVSQCEKQHKASELPTQPRPLATGLAAPGR